MARTRYDCLRVRIRHAKALGIIVAVEAVLLILVVAAALRSEGHTSFPPAVAVPSPLPAVSVRASVVPVSLNLGTRGTTATMAARLSRGGRAKAAFKRAGPGLATSRRVSAAGH